MGSFDFKSVFSTKKGAKLTSKYEVSYIFRCKVLNMLFAARIECYSPVQFGYKSMLYLPKTPNST